MCSQEAESNVKADEKLVTFFTRYRQVPSELKLIIQMAINWFRRLYLVPPAGISVRAKLNGNQTSIHFGSKKISWDPVEIPDWPDWQPKWPPLATYLRSRSLYRSSTANSCQVAAGYWLSGRTFFPWTKSSPQGHEAINDILTKCLNSRKNTKLNWRTATYFH